MKNTTDFKEGSQIGWKVTNRASKPVSADWTNPRRLYIEDNKDVGLLMLIQRARVKHKHKESKYATCRARRYLAGLGSRLWFRDDLHGDDAVGFFLQAQKQQQTKHLMYSTLLICVSSLSVSPSLTTIAAYTFLKQTWLKERTALCDVTKGCDTFYRPVGKLHPTTFSFVPLTAASLLALQFWQEVVKA